MENLTLLSLFEQSETDLRKQLADLQLPRDEEKFNRILSDLFVEHIKVDEYKQELTPSEMAIFQSAIQLVETCLQLNDKMFSFDSDLASNEIVPANDNIGNFFLNKNQMTGGIVAGVGALIAGALPNYWGSVLIAIIATAASLCLLREGENVVEKKTVIRSNIRINSDAVIVVAKNICRSVDNLMQVYNTNIDNLKSRIEDKPEPTLHNSYGYLLNRLASLYRDKTNNGSQEEIEEDIDKIFKTLKNYNYEFVNYSKDTAHFFDVEEIGAISQAEVADVAILEKGECVVKGKYYQPKK